MADIIGVVITTPVGFIDIDRSLAPELFDAKAKHAMRESMKLLQKIAQDKTPVDTGRAQRTLRTAIIGRTVNITGVLASPESYFYNLEYGRSVGAAMPPEPPLTAWANRHGIEGRGAVFLIRRAISRRGIRPLHIMQGALDQGMPDIVRMWMKEFDGYPSRS
jgi:hypothetical protein